MIATTDGQTGPEGRAGGRVFARENGPGLPRSAEADLAAGDIHRLAVLADLRGLGLAFAEPLVEAALARGVSARELLGLVRVYQSHWPRWSGPGALGWRLKSALPGEDPSDLRLWPKPGEHWLAAERRRLEKECAERRRLEKECAERRQREHEEWTEGDRQAALARTAELRKTIRRGQPL